jgi:hypothetical protein
VTEKIDKNNESRKHWRFSSAYCLEVKTFTTEAALVTPNFMGKNHNIYRDVELGISLPL